MEKIAEALKPYGFDWVVSITGIPGPGNIVVVFATMGDLLTACLTHDYKVVWVLSCGGSEDGYTEDANAVHESARALFAKAA